MAEDSEKTGDSPETYEEFEAKVINRFGLTVGGKGAREALGFDSSITFQRAVRDGSIPLPLFTQEGRRGVFLLATDLARYLWKRRALAEQLLGKQQNSGKATGRDK
jgi:hypothetical protein